MTDSGGVAVAVSVTAITDMSRISFLSAGGFCDFERKEMSLCFNGLCVGVSAVAGVDGKTVFSAGGGDSCFDI